MMYLWICKKSENYQKLSKVYEKKKEEEKKKKGGRKPGADAEKKALEEGVNQGENRDGVCGGKRKGKSSSSKLSKSLLS